MTIHKEGVRNAAFLISEAEHYRSRDAGTVDAGAGKTLESGSVLGKRTADKVLVQFDPAANDGSEVVHSALYERVAGSARRTVICRAAQVKADLLIWKDGMTAEQKSAGIEALKALGIISR